MLKDHPLANAVAIFFRTAPNGSGLRQPPRVQQLSWSEPGDRSAPGKSAEPKGSDQHIAPATDRDGTSPHFCVCARPVQSFDGSHSIKTNPNGHIREVQSRTNRVLHSRTGGRRFTG